MEKIIGYTAPVNREVLGDPLLFSKIVAMLHTGAQQECMRAAEGRTYTVETVRLVMGKRGLSFIRSLFDAEIQLTITIDDNTSAYPAFGGKGEQVRTVEPGQREVEVLIGKVNGGHRYTVQLTPHMRGDQIIYAGYLESNDTWYYTDD